jgi:hypothetical protein
VLTRLGVCRYQSLPQKVILVYFDERVYVLIAVLCYFQVVQARMWAQGLTIGVLVAAGALTHKNRQEAAASGMRRVSVMR